MTKIPMSDGVVSRPGDFSTPAVPPCSSERSPRVLLPNDRHLLALLGEHAVLTTNQLVRLSGLPERTVQHRLGRLQRSGLVRRFRPHRAVGTAPYHCWLTVFGADAIGAEQPVRWDEDTAAMRSVASLTEFWLQLRDNGVGNYALSSWRRLPDSVPVRDRTSEATRSLPVEAALSITQGDAVRRALVLARTEQMPPPRLVAVLARYAAYLANRDATTAPVLLVLTLTARRHTAVLAAAEQLETASVAQSLSPRAIDTAMGMTAVAASEPRPAALITEACWRSPGDPHPRRLADVLAAGAR